ncbi:MAG: AGCS family alanine or glycine:cation symporter [Chlamydiales bacterium]|jgi:AGCS family alanine or glycine:cation symporter
MGDLIFAWLDSLDGILWELGVVFIVFFGLYLGVVSRFFQLRKFPQIVSKFFNCAKSEKSDSRGEHPLKVFFTSIGGAIGIGNVVGVCTAVQIGGPGAIFWVWVAGFLGMLIKYSEVYLGVLYRVNNDEGGYDGGPMYFLQKAYKTKWIPSIVCILLCIYGTEIYMFGVMTDSISLNWNLNRFFVMAVLLFLVIYAAQGGIKRVGNICSAIIPVFVGLFGIMSLWVVLNNLAEIPAMLNVVFTSAFSGHAAVGGFAGASVMLAMSQGVARGCYSGDIGVGYASIIHSETRLTDPGAQAGLAIFGIFLDTFVVCTFSLFLILVTGVWQESIDSSLLVQAALESFFPHMDLFMPFFLFLLGYSSMIAFFCVGLKCAKFLSPKKGTRYYYIYAISALIFFSFFDKTCALTVMSLSGVLLLFINVVGIFRLRKDIKFND